MNCPCGYELTCAIKIAFGIKNRSIHYFAFADTHAVLAKKRTRSFYNSSSFSCR